jgi:hypothetical protein
LVLVAALVLVVLAVPILAILLLLQGVGALPEGPWQQQVML